MLKFVAGLMIGGTMGVVIMCLMFVAKEADRHIENYTSGISRREETGTSELSEHTESGTE